MGIFPTKINTTDVMFAIKGAYKDPSNPQSAGASGWFWISRMVLIKHNRYLLTLGTSHVQEMRDTLGTWNQGESGIIVTLDDPADSPSKWHYDHDFENFEVIEEAAPVRTVLMDSRTVYSRQTLDPWELKHKHFNAQSYGHNLPYGKLLENNEKGFLTIELSVKDSLTGKVFKHVWAITGDNLQVDAMSPWITATLVEHIRKSLKRFEKFFTIESAKVTETMPSISFRV